ncbi:hypothetical protein BXZ70DRAFT_1008795 [Cristinia sonorae]|uniref:Uncharacterized protein n=1 Tax=Cristinia sonorae TaxID=1940300 RepID=A0A8K0XPQ3_9AGAR|nr:hypothetical protein BXZ70DRAFT_1008795 [Cristinia sonorae]
MTSNFKFPFWPRKQSSRKFIDLIWRTTTRWANWDPSEKFQPGDFGYTDHETGRFHRTGNIYLDPHIGPIAQRYKPQKGEVVEKYIANTGNAVAISISAGGHVDALSAAEVLLQGCWKFNRARGALLAMYKYSLVTVPDEFFNEDLSSFECLKGKQIVTQVYVCPAYALYLSNKNNETFSLALRATSPTGVPGISAGSHLSMNWVSHDVSGLFHHGSNANSSFYPLLVIKEVRRLGSRRREAPEPGVPVLPEGTPGWFNIEPPWGDLDEEGDEDSRQYADDSDTDF